jgi:hypothetical protein
MMRARSDFLAVVALASTLGLWACAAGRPRGAESSAPLATSLQELAPHADRDHFVYLFTRRAEGQLVDDGIQVEHINALDASGEFEVTLTENGMGAGRVRIRDTGTAILLLAEDDLTRGIGLAYDPPLPFLAVPLFGGEQRATSTATATALADGQLIGSLNVTQVVHASVGPPVRSRLGNFERTIALRTVRTLQGPEGNVELSSDGVVVPGIGEIRSDGVVQGAPTVHRELTCATVGGRAIGDCRNLKERVEELQRAGSTDVQ